MEKEVESPKEDQMEQESGNMQVKDHLYEAVGNALVAWMNYKAYHWMLFGPSFHDLHDMFGEFADSVYATVDELAERLRMLDQDPPTTLTEICKCAVVKETSAKSPHEMLVEALASTEIVIECMREGAEAAQAEDDPGTVDMFSKFVQIYEKQRWFIKQLLRGEAK
jgi:starvation-inducible DNA-binding protein